jgi:hypothetical protein
VPDVKAALANLVARLRELYACQTEIAERLDLLNRPWEEDMLHWAWNGGHWELHGRLSPPPDGRRRSTTRQGWCPGCRSRSQRNHRQPGGDSREP